MTDQTLWILIIIVVVVVIFWVTRDREGYTGGNPKGQPGKPLQCGLASCLGNAQGMARGCDYATGKPAEECGKKASDLYYWCLTHARN